MERSALLFRAPSTLQNKKTKQKQNKTKQKKKKKERKKENLPAGATPERSGAPEKSV